MGVLSTSDPAGVVASYMASFDSGNPEAIAGHVSADFESVHTAALGHGFTGGDEYRRRLPNFLADMAGVHYDVRQTVVDGTTVVVAYEMTARWKGEHPVTVPGTMWFDVVDGEITRRVDYWDSKVFTDQIPDAS
ncbi:MAG: nuclear transport factor 2 family protein [Acidimicrobiales bacterium]